ASGVRPGNRGQDVSHTSNPRANALLNNARPFGKFYLLFAAPMLRRGPTPPHVNQSPPQLGVNSHPNRPPPRTGPAPQPGVASNRPRTPTPDTVTHQTLILSHYVRYPLIFCPHSEIWDDECLELGSERSTRRAPSWGEARRNHVIHRMGNVTSYTQLKNWI